MKDIELPRKVLVGDDALYEVDSIITQLKLTGNPLILCDPVTEEVAAKTVAEELGHKTTVIDDRQTHIEKDTGYVIGVGGGRVIDKGKVVAFDNNLPYISVPTAASHDGIASPQASIKTDQPTSIQVHCPDAVIVDTKVVAKAPKRLLASGAADAISNYTAVLDWELSHHTRNEYYGDYAAALSAMSAEIVMDNAEKIHENVSILVEALISSGVAIGIAGSSRPCSGSEHMFSHTLDIICENPALHGEQCGVGTIMMAYLHKADWQRVRNSLKKCGAPTCAKELQIPEDKIIEALTKAHDIRDRHTILGDGLSEERAREVAEKAKVIK